MKRDINGSANTKTARERIRLKTTEVRTAVRIPFLIRSVFPAPKFWAIKMEKALPKSCTGR